MRQSEVDTEALQGFGGYPQSVLGSALRPEPAHLSAVSRQANFVRSLVAPNSFPNLIIYGKAIWTVKLKQIVSRISRSITITFFRSSAADFMHTISFN